MGGGGCFGREGTSEAAPEAVGQAVAKAVGGSYCRLQMPLRLALAVRGAVAGHRLGALEEGGGGGKTLPLQCIAGWQDVPACDQKTGLLKDGGLWEGGPPHNILGFAGGVLKKEKKVFLNGSFAKRPRVAHMFNPWLVAIGGWRFALGGWSQLAVGGGWWWLAAVGGWWRLAMVGSWPLVAVGGWRLVVPWGGP